jgi:hypothetical protein
MSIRSDLLCDRLSNLLRVAIHAVEDNDPLRPDSSNLQMGLPDISITEQASKVVGG